MPEQLTPEAVDEVILEQEEEQEALAILDDTVEDIREKSLEKFCILSDS